MAKRKKRKTKKQLQLKRTIQFEVGALILLTLCIITIANLGLVGRVLVSFCQLLFGEWYMILPLGGVILSFYLIWKREWPNFFNRYLIGIYLILIAVLLLHHISLFELLSRPSPFVKKSVITNTWDLFVMEINGDTSTTGLGGGMVGALLYTGFPPGLLGSHPHRNHCSDGQIV